MPQLLIEWKHDGWYDQNKVQKAIELGALVHNETNKSVIFKVSEELTKSNTLPFYFDILKPVKIEEDADVQI